MASVEQTAVTRIDICEIVRSWPLCSIDGQEHVIVTHCQFPNGSLVKVRVRQVGGEVIVSDGGAALDEAIASGVEQPAFGLAVRRVARSKGLSFVDGRIETPRIPLESLFNGMVVIANTACEIAEMLIATGNATDDTTLEKRTRRVLVDRFHSWVSARPLIINGASERAHKFDNALVLPDGRKVLVDVARHQGNSINATVVANLDVKRLENPRLVQRIVFDPKELWKPEEIELLGVGAVPVALPSLGDAIQRIAA